MISAVIFDLDGVLIESVPLWKAAATGVLAGVGVPAVAIASTDTTGLTTNEAVRYWHDRYHWPDYDEEDLSRQIDQGVMHLIRQRTEAKPGTEQAISACGGLELPMALVSSFPQSIVDTALEKLRLAHHFKAMVSANNSLPPKPHPAIYLEAAEKLAVPPSQCLAVDSAIKGIIAAKAASMAAIAIPAPAQLDDKRYGVADRVLPSLVDLTPSLIQSLSALA